MMRVKLSVLRDDTTIWNSEHWISLQSAIRILKQLEKNEVERLTKEALDSKQPYILFDFIKDD